MPLFGISVNFRYSQLASDWAFRLARPRQLKFARNIYCVTASLTRLESAKQSGPIHVLRVKRTFAFFMRATAKEGITEIRIQTCSPNDVAASATLGRRR